MSKHTPGPWNYSEMIQNVVGRSIGGCNLEESDFLIADIRGWGHLQYLPNGAEIQDANGRLIAASPDLYAVLKELQESAAYWSEYDVPLGIVDRINQAIAKAEGTT